MFLIFFVSDRLGAFAVLMYENFFSAEFFACSKEATKTTNTQNNTNLAKYSAATAVQNSIK